MLLSELKTGEKGVIVKVLGHGGFRKRIVEMGFIRGKIIEVVLNAPLKDPIKYRVMGYEVSLRRKEADLVEVVTEDEAHHIRQEQLAQMTEKAPEMEKLTHITEDELTEIAMQKRRTINVALVGNPNSGKTSLFNVASGAHEHVGNYSGVTVNAKEGHFKFQGYEFKLVDLPGTYSLSAYTPEELYVRRHIVQEMPDIIINVVDASNLERNLYLTTQLIDMNVRMVIALNMYDELEASGNKLDHILLSQLLGVPMIPTVSKKSWGIDNLFHVIINLYEGADYMDEDGNIDPEIMQYIQLWHEKEVYEKHAPQPEDYAHRIQKEGFSPKKVFRHIHINHRAVLEAAIEKIKTEIARDDAIDAIRAQFSTRFLSIKLLEKDKEVEERIARLSNGTRILQTRDREADMVHKELREESESAIINAKYAFIAGALRETFKESSVKPKDYTKKIDAFVLHKHWGYPVFILVLFFIFLSTFLFGNIFADLLEKSVEMLGDRLNEVMTKSAAMTNSPLKDLLVIGVFKGVGAVIVFLPNILILYLGLSFLEDTGYMARAVFIMDRIMHKIGLHGKSFIPLVMGFGCNVPAIVATRTIESHKSRLITILINPFMSCSARLSVYVILISTLFRGDDSLSGLLLSSCTFVGIYLIGIALAAITAKILSKWIFKGEDIPFVMELPPYRMPTAKSIGRHAWEKGKQYLKKMGGIILVAAVIVWYLSYFPNHAHYETVQQQQENSYLGKIGHAVEPLFKPLGFDWKMSIGIMAGVGAKEVVASTLTIIYYGSDDKATMEKAEKKGLPIDSLNAFVYMLFVLIYFPCLATIAAIKKETGRWKYALFSVFYSTGLAWAVCFVIYQLGSLF
ncbi:MAG: ferrous iron transport protein B [Bacteroidales bacterium]|jgi:ferrous iron transport protein B|nr:ferrous iron transport protein B [Bacteroidales bacterium]